MKNYFRYFYAVLAVPLAVLLRFALQPLVGPGTPYITLFPATIAVALLAGLGPAILAGVLGSIAIDYLFIEPLYAIEFTVGGLSRMAVITLTSVFVGYVGDALRAARTKAEKQALTLRESQERLSTVFRASPTGIFVTRLADGLFLEANEAYLQIIGYSADEVIGHTSLELDIWVNSEDRKWVVSTLREKGRIENNEIKLRRKNGEIIDLLYSSLPLERGEEHCILGTLIDITSRKKAEEALRESHKTFSKLIERSPFGTYVVDSSFCIAMMNTASQNGAFRNVRPVIGRPFNEAMHILWPDAVAEEIIAHFRHTLDTGEPYYSPQFINPRHDDKIVESYEWELHRMMLTDGQYGVICYYFDSTKLREAEDALLTSETRYRRLFEAAREGILILDSDSGQIVDVNPFIKEMLGYSHDELLNRKLWEIGLFKNIVASKKSFLELQTKGYVRYENLPIETKDGRSISVEFVSNVYMVDHRKVIQCNIRDITDRVKAEEAIRETNEELKRFNLAAVGRELRMIELKKEVNYFCGLMGQPQRYPLNFEKENDSEKGKT